MSEPAESWIERLEQGSETAAHHLWNAYFERLVRLAERRINVRQLGDGEDVALSAINSLIHGVRQGRFDNLGDADSIWRLLVVITVRKSMRHVEHELAQKRGGNRRLQLRGDERSQIEDIVAHELTPEMIVMLDEQCQCLLDTLDDEILREVALCKLNGDSTTEIAAKMNCVPRTVRRYLELIREIWRCEL
jgi:DNA-directed RNA polymerase specialized sigma24 family protein